MVEKTVSEDNSEGVFYSDKLYDFHKYCIKFPRMKSDRIMEISESVLKFGQLEDIILLDNLILDGRHLYWACKAAGITPRFRNFDSNLHPWAYVKIKNLHRRDLTTAQRAALALEDLKIERQIAKERQVLTYFKDKNDPPKNLEKYTVSHPGSPTVTDTKKGKAVDIVAKEWGIAPKSLRKVDKINEIAKKNPFIKKYWEWAKNEDIPLEEIYRTIRKALDFHNSKTQEKYEEFSKVTKIYEEGKIDPTIKELLEKVKRGEISLDDADQKLHKIKAFKKSIRKHNVDSFGEASKVYKKEKDSRNSVKYEETKKVISNKKIDAVVSQFENSLKKNICKLCPKATVMAIKCECEECGHLNLTSKVLCDDDITNGSRKLREPNQQLCKNSPDYDLLLKN